MPLAAAFDHTHLWAQEYQRNNKRSGLKNLRCFPYCSPTGHVAKGFCGAPLFLRVNRLGPSSNRPLFAWGEFRRMDEDDGKRIQVGQTLSGAELQQRSEDASLNSPFHEATVSSDAARSGQAVIFTFNERRKGWNYSWGASKHTAHARHAFVAYVFEGDVLMDQYTCVSVCPTPEFSLFCRKREGMPADSPEFGGAEAEGGDDEDPAVAFLLGGGVAASSSSGASSSSTSARAGAATRKRRPSAAAMAAAASAAASASSSSSNGHAHAHLTSSTSSTTTTTAQAKRPKASTASIFSLLTPRGLLGLGGGNDTPLGMSATTTATTTGMLGAAAGVPPPSHAVASPGQFSLGGFSWADVAADVLDTDDDMGGGADEEPMAAVNPFPPPTDPLASWRVAAVLAKLDPVLRAADSSTVLGLNKFVLDDFLGDIDFLGSDFQTTSGEWDTSPSPVPGGLEQWKAVEPLPFAPAASASASSSTSTSASTSTSTSTSKATSSSTGTPGATETDDVFRALANFLVEDAAFTARIRQIISYDRDGVFASTSDRRAAFVSVIHASVEEFLAKNNMSRSDFDALLSGADASVVDAALARWEEHAKHMVEEEAAASASIISTERPTFLSPLVNFSGTWRFDDELRDTLDEIRRLRGVPYMLRRLLSAMERVVRIEQSSLARIVAYGTPVLLASSKAVYELDRESHEWHVALPIPWNRLCETYVAWIEEETNTLVYVHEYSPTSRSVRRVVKDATGERVSFTASLEDRASPSAPWKAVFTGKGFAFRLSEAW